MAELVVIEGQDIGKTFQISNGMSTIGRSNKNHIVLADRRIGKKQARIKSKSSQIVITNLFPEKFLLVNGEPIIEEFLQDGDTITLGNTTFLFSEQESSVGEDQMVPLESIIEGLPDSDEEDTSIHCAKSYDLDSVLLDLSTEDIQERRIATLYKVSHAINDTLDMPKLLDKLLEILFEELTLVERGVILLFDEEHGRFVPVASKIHKKLRSSTIKVSKTILKAAYKKRRSIMSGDARSDQRFQEGMSIVEENIRAIMCAPLIHKEEVIGFIHLDTTSFEKRFKEENLNFLTAISMQAAMALAHASNYQKHELYAKKLKELGKATQELSYHLERKPIIRSLGRFLFKILNCRRCLLALIKEDNKLVFTPYVVKSKSAEWDETQLSLIKELSGKVIVNNAPILISDLTFDPDLYFEEPRSEKLDSFLIVPVPAKSEEMEGKSQAIGAICISEKTSGGVFTKSDQELLTILANQVGIALTNSELYEQATIDSLTKVFVRRYFFQRLTREIQRSFQLDQPLSLLMMDLDHFKIKNDTYGHQAGDYILEETGKIMKANLRSEHVVARYGGEEFAVILRDQPREQAFKIAERLRMAIESKKYLFEGNLIPCTVSIGLSTIQDEDTIDYMIKRADSALYEAKDGGRNRVICR